MADPLTIFGAAASVISIIDVFSRTIMTIRSLRSQWKEADIALLSLTTQLSALSAALGKIQEWMESGVVEEGLHYQLVMDLQASLECCRLLGCRMWNEVEEMSLRRLGEEGTMALGERARFVLMGGGMGEVQGMIDRQISALGLLLAACNRYVLDMVYTFFKRTRGFCCTFSRFLGTMD